MHLHRRVLAATLATAFAVTLAGCVPNAQSDAAIDVTIDDESCKLSVNTIEAGTVSFTLVNGGESVNEFEILGDDQLQIVAEKENIANDGNELVFNAQLQPGDYFTACKPNMVGAPVGLAAFTVTGESFEVDASDQAAIDAYVAYTKSQVGELVTAVDSFAAAYASGDADKARDLFPLTRQYYERIEPTAEQFGDLDPALDYRLPGAVAELDEWTGFHRIELDLWLEEGIANYEGETFVDQDGEEQSYLDLVDGEDRPVFEALDEDGRQYYADKLVEDTKKLYDLVYSDDFSLSVADISNGAVGLLDEVAAPDGKLPGEEDEFSHTDLYDFVANVEGASVAYENVRALALESDGGAALTDDLDAKFTAMFDALAEYGSFDDGFVSYDEVAQADRNALATKLNALAEPLSRLTAAIS